MTKKEIQNRNLIIVVGGAVLVALFVIFLPQIKARYYAVYNNYYNNNGATMRDPGQGPSEEELQQINEYYAKCPLDELSIKTSVSESKDFYLGKVRCSENIDPEFRAASVGEEGEVEIYTQDFEAGKQLFRDWLADHGLKESPTLRITYTHKPR